MANFRLEVKIHSRSGGTSSVVKAAAYRSAEKLSERDPKLMGAIADRSGEALEAGGEVFDFRRKRGVIATEIHGPMDMPERFSDRGTLWREVEACEKRKDARLAREAIISIPRGLTHEQGIDAVRGWVSEQCVERGMIADVAWHVAKARDGGENFHAHVMTVTREVTAEGFGRKPADWNRREMVQEWRSSWADHANWALEQAGREQRVDHRSLKEQAKEALERGDLARLAKVDREPTVYLKRVDFEREQRGETSPAIEKKREVAERNAERSAFYKRAAEIGTKAREAFLSVREKLGDALQAGRAALGLERAPERAPERHQPANWLDRHVPVYHHKPKERGYELEI